MEENNRTDKKNKTSFIDRYKRVYRKHPILFHLMYIIITGCVLMLAALIFLDYWTHHGEETTVPDVKGMSIERASAEFTSANLNMQIVDTVYSDAASPGQIMEQEPKAGAIVKPNGIVYLTINSFDPEPIRIYTPIVGTSELEAVSNLENYGFKNIIKRYVDTEYEDKLVLSAMYNGKPITVGSVVPKNATITIEVGRIPEVDIIGEIPGTTDSSGDVLLETADDEMFDAF